MDAEALLHEITVMEDRVRVQSHRLEQLTCYCNAAAKQEEELLESYSSLSSTRLLLEGRFRCAQGAILELQSKTKRRRERLLAVMNESCGSHGVASHNALIARLEATCVKRPRI